MSNSRIILLTGATRGLGRSLVERFTAAGHRVVGCGRSAEHVAALRATFGSPHRFDVVDVTDDAAVAAWSRELVAAGLVPELLINNAAVINTPRPLWEVPADEFQTLVDVNILGVANVIRHIVPAMIARRSGVIVNLSSGWGRSTAPDVAPYCATKYAIEGLTLALAQELPKGMAAVPMNPGIINTDMLRQCFADGASAYPGPDEWSRSAAPFLLQLSARDNGKSLTVPD
jgi:NAD(P)-dependent dehydrogenase (short-subunit alcohol dehydrogenase family)